MIRDLAVELIKQQFGMRRTGDTVIVQNLVLAQVGLEMMPTKPWFLLSEKSTVVTTINEQRVPIPSDFIMEYNEEGLSYIDADGTEHDLVKADVDTLKVYFKEEGTGEPAAYALVGDYFRLFPTPAAAYNIGMIYYQKDATLDTNIENKWLKYVPHLLMGTALSQIATPLRDKAAMEQAKLWIAMGSQILNAHNVARDSANRVDQIGGKHY